MIVSRHPNLVNASPSITNADAPRHKRRGVTLGELAQELSRKCVGAPCCRCNILTTPQDAVAVLLPLAGQVLLRVYCRACDCTMR